MLWIGLVIFVIGCLADSYSTVVGIRMGFSEKQGWAAWLMRKLGIVGGMAVVTVIELAGAGVVFMAGTKGGMPVPAAAVLVAGGVAQLLLGWRRNRKLIAARRHG